MPRHFCGLDFGTSNSAIGIKSTAGFELVPVEGENKIIPSAVFFDFESGKIQVGKKAKDSFMQQTEGRLLLALKSILSSNAMEYYTEMNGIDYTYMEIIGIIINYLKKKAEEKLGDEIENVVLGRPVHFGDSEPEKDSVAQNRLEQIAKDQGFKNVVFQYEPVAAALDYQLEVTKEQIALIADIGGGTSDFSIVRFSSASQANDSAEILANNGIRLGGTDFDRLFSLHSFMPHFGLSTFYTDVTGKRMSIPKSGFHDMANWHGINRLYENQSLSAWRYYLRHSSHSELLKRFVTALEYHLGHQLYQIVEETKISLSQHDQQTVDLGFVEPDFKFEVHSGNLTSAIFSELKRLETAVIETILEAGLKKEQIDCVYYTGGSTYIPVVRDTIKRLVPNADVVRGDAFGSVASGLAIDAWKKFG